MLAIVTIACAFGASARGGYVGGSLGFAHESDSWGSTNHFSILPEVGYKFNNKWAIGTTIGYDYTHYCGEDMSTHVFQLEPYARFTFFRTSNNLVNLFVDGGLGIGVGSISYRSYSYDYDSAWGILPNDERETMTIFSVGFTPGIAVNLTEKFSLVAHIGFLGYRGGDSAAIEGGLARFGGLSLDASDIKFGFYYNF